jgi:[ribosomal protein S5]-alanine N-acetyltransferase
MHPRLPDDTERIAFRSWREEDVDLARGLWGDPRVTALVSRVPFDDAMVRERLAVEIGREREHGYQYWAIFEVGSGAHAGCCGLKPKDLEAKVLEIGFQLCHRAWGRGIATEAARSVVRHAFDRLGAARLFAGHHPENHGSRRTLEKLGFRFSHDELYAPTGLLHPGYFLERS